MTDTRMAVVDCETTGLDPSRHEVWEVGYILLPEGIRQKMQLAVTLENADAEALRVGGFHRQDRRVPPYWAPHSARRQLLADLERRVFAGNNPQFDAGFLAALIGSRPWHYHLVDVKALVAGRLGLEPPWSTQDLLERCGLSTNVAHEALADAEQALAMYRWAMS